jgi:hypothetical protein
MILNKSSKKVLYISLLLLFSLLGCTQKKSLKGSDLIPRDQLVEVLTDIHLMDGITNDLKFYRKFNAEDSIDLFAGILEKYGVDRDRYEHTIEEYSKYPELLNEVYDEVLMELNLMLEREENKKEAENKLPVRDATR